ncbi:hypothetical protein GF339_08390, partial [candidate division KSB3 bacterium]|nr:hypothetical protein [candidate division KSB3 bacterium]MBD3324590.1 hypothetical protein [candidate division KSB3 bacterium]
MRRSATYLGHTRLIRWLLLFALLSLPASHALAFDPDANSGSNYQPDGATTIRQTTDSRWVIYDRGDQTDWLTVSPPETQNEQLIVTFKFVRLVGTAIVEVYGPDPSGEILERAEIASLQTYTYTTNPPSNHYFRIYVEGEGNLAKYEFTYQLTQAPTPTPPPTATPTLTPSPTPMPTSTPTPLPTATPTLTPTPVPTA